MAALLVLLISGFAHGLEEVVEDAVHTANYGHCFHADDHPEGETPPDPEEGCVGFSHHCGCCFVAAALARGMPAPWVAVAVSRPPPHDSLGAASGVRDRVDRPPRG